MESVKASMLQLDHAIHVLQDITNLEMDVEYHPTVPITTQVDVLYVFMATTM